MKKEQEKVLHQLSTIEIDVDGFMKTQLIHPVTFEDVKKMAVFDIHLQDFDEVGRCNDRNCLLCIQTKYEVNQLMKGNQ